MAETVLLPRVLPTSLPCKLGNSCASEVLVPIGRCSVELRLLTRLLTLGSCLKLLGCKLDGHTWCLVSCKSWLDAHILTNRVLLQWHELQVLSESLFVGQKGLDSLLVLRDEGRLRKTILLILDQLTEVDHEAPRVRSKRLESLKEDYADLLLDVRFRLVEETQQDDAEEECVAVGIAQLIDNTVQEAEPCFVVEHDCNLFEQFDAAALDRLSLVGVIVFLFADQICNVEHNSVDHG